MTRNQSETVSESENSLTFSEQNAGDYRLGVITLNNPRALNALDLAMFRKMEARLLEWRKRSDVACVVLHTNSEKAFCAGGDVKALVLGLQNSGLRIGLDYFTAEYFVDFLIHAYEKPVLCWADGITMGGGIGIMNGASLRVVTERTVMAMPEAAIGLFPDVGGTYFLNRLPEGLGLFLALTSARFSGNDAVAIGMADLWIPSAKKAAALASLPALQWTRDPVENKDILRDHLSPLAHRAPPSGLMERLEVVRALMRRCEIAEIDRGLREWRGDDPWIAGAVQGYLSASPTSVSAILKTTRRRKRAVQTGSVSARMGYGA